MELIVLAGGLGTRLRSVVEDLPKPMAPVAGRPFLEHVLQWAGTQGVTHAVLAVSYQWEKIQAHFGNHFQQIALSYSVETQPLGTGGGLRAALEYTTEPQIYSCNGDTLFPVNLTNLLTVQKQHDYVVTLATRTVADVSRYGLIQTQDTHITAFSQELQPKPGEINGGIYVISRSWLSQWELGLRFSFEQDALPHCQQAGAYHAEQYFIDIGIPQDYQRAQRELS